MKNTFSPLLAVVFVIFLVIALVAYLRDQRTKSELRQRGVTVTARVISRTHTVHRDANDPGNVSKTSDSYSVAYQYVVNGATYSSSDSVDSGVYDILREGQPIEVVYLPDNPAEARLASSL